MHVVVVSFGNNGDGPNEGSSQFPQLQSDLRLVKPAILYATQVTLISGAYSITESMARELGSFSTTPEKFVDFLASMVSPMSRIEEAHGVPNSLRGVIRLRDKCRLTPNGRKREQRRQELRSMLEPFVTGRLLRLLDCEGLSELNAARDMAAVTIESVPGIAGSGGLGAIAEELAAAIGSAYAEQKPSPAPQLVGLASGTMKRLVDVIATPDYYPLLDSAARGMIDPQTAAATTPAGRARASHAGFAGHVMGHLPLLDAPIAEIVAIRDRVSPHLDQFRGAMADLATTLRPVQWERDFEAEAGHLYLTRVEPAVADLELKLRDFDKNRWVKLITRAGTGVAVGAAATGVALAAAPDLVETWFDSALMQLSLNALPLGLSATVVQWIAQYLDDTRAQRSALTGNEFYYFHETRRMLESVRPRG